MKKINRGKMRKPMTVAQFQKISKIVEEETYNIRSLRINVRFLNVLLTSVEANITDKAKVKKLLTLIDREWDETKRKINQSGKLLTEILKELEKALKARR